MFVPKSRTRTRMDRYHKEPHQLNYVPFATASISNVSHSSFVPNQSHPDLAKFIENIYTYNIQINTQSTHIAWWSRLGPGEIWKKLACLILCRLREDSQTQSRM